jgi:protein tyrosine phosphatase (PTP) superfamily phosphohydrolase (DUF442 family)
MFSQRIVSDVPLHVRGIRSISGEGLAVNTFLGRCFLILAWCFAPGCSKPPAPPQAAAPIQPASGDATVQFAPKKLDAKHLPNPWQVHPKVISGGLPEGDAAFAELAKLGVKTVISVDGAKPDLMAAKQHGLRYVHLPHGYDGVPEVRVRELAKAVRDLPGLIYIHCHHGKHRSPAAAAVACVAAGLMDPTSAELVLRAAGTSENYRGLYQSARTTRKIDGSALDKLIAAFPETTAVPPLAEAMVALEHTHDHLKQVAANGWNPTAAHPDLEPAHEALLLREHFTELLRLDAVQSEPAEFRRYLTESEAAAQDLERALRTGLSADKSSATFAKISQACAGCHKQFRDIPLGEKGK